MHFCPKSAGRLAYLPFQLFLKSLLRNKIDLLFPYLSVQYSSINALLCWMENCGKRLQKE